MHKRRPEFFVINILIAIDKIKRKNTNISFETFLHDENIVDLTMRNLEIIGEATNQLLKHPHFLDKTNSNWRKIVDFRNLVIHFYFGIDFDLVFNDIIKNKIPLLEQDILNLIKQKTDLTIFLQALEDAQADLTQMHRHASINYLEKIKKFAQ